MRRFINLSCTTKVGEPFLPQRRCTGFRFVRTIASAMTRAYDRKDAWADQVAPTPGVPRKAEAD
jgi:hypothetical protein